MVSWNKQLLGNYKLNTDGSTLHESGKAGGGGIQRDDLGKIIYAFSIPFGITTNNIAELKAALYGLEWCQQHGYKRIELEVDSQLVYKWINNIANTPWRCQQFVQQISQIQSNLDYFHCTHIYRESNSTADLLAKLNHNLDIPQQFYTSHQLMGAIRGSYILERMGIQNFRRRKIKRIKHPP